jgi:hypothetical protein
MTGHLPVKAASRIFPAILVAGGIWRLQAGHVESSSRALKVGCINREAAPKFVLAGYGPPCSIELTASTTVRKPLTKTRPAFHSKTCGSLRAREVSVSMI